MSTDFEEQAAARDPDTASVESDERAPFALRRDWFGRDALDFQLTRFVLLRGLGGIYLIGFLIIVQQWLPLVGEQGLMPVTTFLGQLREAVGSTSGAFWRAPSLFWLDASDGFMLALGWVGLLLSLAVVAGFANAPLMFVLWLLYGAFVHVGQTFYGYGWEMLLLEAGFLGVFLASPWRLRIKAADVPPLPVIWLYRWLTFRLMFGAGLIKIRGDACWRDLSCLVYHYETQPNPHPLSWWIHQAPEWVHQGGVLFNHFAELVVPFGLLGPRRLRHWAGAITIAFQATIILSGNLSFLNWLTIVIALSCFDDSLLSRLLPTRWVSRLLHEKLTPLERTRRWVLTGLCMLVGLLSLNPVFNMLDPHQRMNASFDPLHLVNTYGAFGSVGRVRHEVVIEGTDGDPDDIDAAWLAYEFPCKPTDPMRAPCLITPYHYRLDWQLWFAGFGNPRREPWIVHLVQQLLEGRESALRLVERNPFPDRPPAYVRIRLFRYEFTKPGQVGWWRRHYAREYLPAVALGDPRLSRFLRRRGWE